MQYNGRIETLLLRPEHVVIQAGEAAGCHAGVGQMTTHH